jgi:hypothetical protein
MHIFAEPVTEDEVEEMQSTNAARIKEFERNIMGLPGDKSPKLLKEAEHLKDWAEIQADTREAMDTHDLSLTDGAHGNDPSPTPENSNENDTQELSGGSEDNGHVENPEDGTTPTVTAGAFPSSEGPHDTRSSESAEADFDVTADTIFLDSIAESAAAPPEGKMSAWTLRIRNRVNGTYVDRPEQLKSTDTWHVDYSLVEIADSQRAWGLYQACQLRRKDLCERDAESEDRGSFINTLRKLSQEGADWREKLDKADKAKPRIVLTPSHSHSTSG